MEQTKAARLMAEENTSLIVRWCHSTTAQGAALGAVLGPVGMMLSFLFSAKAKRTERTFGALKGSVAASLLILAVLALVLVVSA